MSGLRQATKQHCVWLIILSCFMAGWWVESWIKEKRYKELWRVQAEEESWIKEKRYKELWRVQAEEDCRPKIMVHPGKQTADCKVINNFSPTGRKRDNDCGESVWAYSTIQCGEYQYFGWKTWSDNTDEKNVWINGKQYFRSCQWPKNIPDEELKSNDCRYNFLEKENIP